MAPNLLPKSGFMEPARQIPKLDDRLWRYALAPAILLVLICGYFLEENWRGRQEWNALKAKLEAAGGHVDWTNYVPTPVPPEQNFFGVPKMQRWFSGRGGNDLSSRINSARNDFMGEHNTEIVATVTVVKRGEKIPDGTADMVLDFDADLSAMSLAQNQAANAHPETNEIIPLIAMDDVPLSEVVKNLARQAGVTFKLKGRLTHNALAPEPPVSFKWTNLTARQALGAVMKTYDLRFVPDAKTGVGTIRLANSPSDAAGLEAGIAQRAGDLLLKALDEATNAIHGKCAYSAMGVMLTVDQPVAVKPLRIVVRGDAAPSTNQLSAIFPPITNSYLPNLNSGALVESRDSNAFVVRLEPMTRIRAADYVKWSDGFEEDFDLIRESLKRPYVQMTGNYSSPLNVPIPNFISHRFVAQTLTDRAKCHLLLGQPEAALKDLTLVRALCVTMEGKPPTRPMTLVATMIDSAITGLYIDTIAEGFRLGVWREQELLALQEQLRQIDLPPLLVKSFEFERASMGRVLETVKADEFRNITTGMPGGTRTNLWDRLKDPTYAMMKLGPRGWVYQNMIRIASLHADMLKGVDAANRTVSPASAEQAAKDAETMLSRFSPYTFLAAVMVPNFSRAVSTLSRNQCLADEAQIACALERYRFAHGEYPKSLDALVPQFLEKIPHDIVGGQPLKYRVKDNGHFVLYSIGWNEKDDDGVSGPMKYGMPDVTKGDWVWAGSAR